MLFVIITKNANIILYCWYTSIIYPLLSTGQ